MRWFERLADFLAKRGRRRMIQRPNAAGVDEDYLERFYILSTRWLGIYIHRFWAGDDDEGLHDHPWHSISILLKGMYLEHEPERQSVPYGPVIVHVRQPLKPILKIRSKYDAHRITVTEGGRGTWSLFIRFGLNRRKWGFYRERGWEPAAVQCRQK